MRETLSADRLLLAPSQLLLPDGPVAGHAVVVADGVFRDVGPAAEVILRHPDLTPIPLPDTLLMPGFIDAHHHLSQTFGKALAFGEPSEIFRRIWIPLESTMDGEAVHLAAILAAADHHLARWDGHGLIHPSLAVSIPEVATDGMLRAVSARCAEVGAIFQTHANEHLVAVERSLVALGRRPTQALGDLGVLGPQVLPAHATLLTSDEIALLRDTDTAIAYNPVATAWKGNAAAPATMMAALGIRFGLGTDGTRADAFRLVDAAETTQRLCFGLAAGDFSMGGGWTWLDHPLAAGADAIGLGKVTGRIAPGYAADFLLVDLNVPEMLPSWDLTWELVRLANRDQITAVFVAGRPRLWQGWPVDWDARALLRQVRDLAGSVLAGAPIQRIHPVSAEHRRVWRGLQEQPER